MHNWPAADYEHRLTLPDSSGETVAVGHPCGQGVGPQTSDSGSSKS